MINLPYFDNPAVNYHFLLMLVLHAEIDIMLHSISFVVERWDFKFSHESWEND